MDDLIAGLFGALILGEMAKSKAGAVFVLLALAISIPVGTGYWLWTKPVRVTEAIVLAQAREACGSDSSQETPRSDHWGVETNIKVREDGNGSIFCSAASAGRDNEFGTDDDLIAEAQDINKSRIAGAWARTKAVEAVKGVFKSDRSSEDFQSSAPHQATEH